MLSNSGRKADQRVVVRGRGAGASEELLVQDSNVGFALQSHEKGGSAGGWAGVIVRTGWIADES